MGSTLIYLGSTFSSSMYIKSGIAIDIERHDDNRILIHTLLCLEHSRTERDQADSGQCKSWTVDSGLDCGLDSWTEIWTGFWTNAEVCDDHFLSNIVRSS